jgi:ribosomal protein L37E
MSVIYCSGCGKKHDYNFAKPNFCSTCGNPFGLAKLKKVSQAKEDEDLDDDEEGEDYFEDDGESFSNANSVPNIRKIQVDIETAAQYNTFDLGSIIGTESNQTSKTSSPRRNRSTSLEDFKQNKK